jgi:hypothetical protein
LFGENLIDGEFLVLAKRFSHFGKSFMGLGEWEHFSAFDVCLSGGFKLEHERISVFQLSIQ